MIIKKKDTYYNVPDFLIVGAAKSGTTSLSQYLSAHSKIFIPKLKECRFLSKMNPNFKGPGDDIVNKEMVTSLEEYSQVFSNANEQQLICDASVDYLFYYEKTIASIKEIYGDSVPKVIIILRSPIKSTFSMYSHLRRDLRETLSLHDAILAEEERKKNNWEWVWQYSKVAKYYEQVKFYFENYPNEKLKIIILEEFIKNRNEEFNKLLQFLEVEKEEIKLDNIYNKSGKARLRFFQKLILNKTPLVMFLKGLLPDFLKRELINANVSSVKITEEEKNLLLPIFKQDILQLEKLLNKDLSIWYKES